jgi:cytochrome c-type biogenesis protein
MQGLFTALNEGLQGAWPLAVVVAFIWGVASVILSPCHLGTIPLVVGFVSGGAGSMGRGGGFKLATAFALGMLAAIAVAGALAISAGLALAGFSAYMNYAIAAIFLAAGLTLVGLIPLPASGLNIMSFKRKGVGAAVVLGLVFGIGLSPCTFAFMAPILGVALGAASRAPLFGYLLLLVFGVGHCAVIATAGGSTDLVQKYLNWNSRSRGVTVVKIICGLCLIGAASFLIYAA